MKRLTEPLGHVRVYLEPGQPFWRQRRTLVAAWEFMPVTRGNRDMIRAWARLSNIEPAIVNHLRPSLTMTGICQIVKDPKRPKGEREQHVVHPDAAQYINAQLLRPILGSPKPKNATRDDNPAPPARRGRAN